MTEKRNAKAVLVPDIDEPDGLAPGTFEFFAAPESDAPIGMIFKCPCGCGDMSAVDFDVVPRTPDDPHRWHWDGNREAPTLSPSLNKTTGCKWHGFLTAGEFVEC